ncbi:hypothetical protein P5V15_013128 [Pogonomyrmex californicus]
MRSRVFRDIKSMFPFQSVREVCLEYLNECSCLCCNVLYVFVYCKCVKERESKLAVQETMKKGVSSLSTNPNRATNYHHHRRRGFNVARALCSSCSAKNNALPSSRQLTALYEIRMYMCAAEQSTASMQFAKDFFSEPAAKDKIPYDTDHII